jgi:2-C-methyl-D-erythritol 2,4-cyclodiphosphate synthase
VQIVLILSGGTSERFGRNKLLEVFGGESVIVRTVRAFVYHPELIQIFIVGGKEIQEELKDFSSSLIFAHSGRNRYESLQNGLDAIKKWSEEKAFSHSSIKVLVHNGANPLVSPEEISSVFSAITLQTVVGVGRQIFGTVRRICGKHIQSIPREGILEMETPQGAIFSDFEEWISFWNTKFADQIPSDEIELGIRSGAAVVILPAENRNRKITRQEDMGLLSSFLPKRAIRTGIGIDSHAFEKGKKCMLCRVEIRGSDGFFGNSDGDVALHALANALSSAFGGDSFSHIADPLCKKGIIDSAVYIREIMSILLQKKGKVEHIALAFEGSRPSLEQHFSVMRACLVKLLQISSDCIGLTATSGEGTELEKGDALRVIAIATVSFSP